MNRDKIIKALETLRANVKKRNFTQSIDLIINLKDFDVKKEGKIEEFIQLPKGLGRKCTICAFVGGELATQAKTVCDEVILADDFPKWTNTRKIKKLARKYDFFIAQATIMPQIAQVFGKYFGPIGKMPNPKGGQIVPPTVSLTPLVSRLRNTAKITVSKSPVIQCKVGNEKMDDSDIIDNILHVIETIEHKLPKGKHNISSILIKTTMSKPIWVK